MATAEEIFELIRKINTHPCKPEDVSQSLTVIQTTLTEIFNTIENRRGTYLARVKASIMGSGCDGYPTTSDATYIDVDGATLEIWGEEDPDDPLPVPTSVKNILTYLVQDDDELIIAFQPVEGGVGEWKLVSPQHKTRTVVQNVGKEGSLFFQEIESKVSTAGGYCPAVDTIATTTTAEVLQTIQLDNSGVCEIKTISAQVEVFAVAPEDEVTAWQYQPVSVLNDVYKTVSCGPVKGFSYVIHTPCLGIEGESTLFDSECCCDDESGSGSGADGSGDGSGDGNSGDYGWVCDGCLVADPPPRMIIQSFSVTDAGCQDCENASVSANLIMDNGAAIGQPYTTFEYPSEDGCRFSGPTFTICADETGQPEGRWHMYWYSPSNVWVLKCNDTNVRYEHSGKIDCTIGATSVFTKVSSGSECNFPATLSVDSSL